MDRPRVNMSFGGFDGHIPSGDPAFDVVAIFAEVKAAAQCRKLVHGNSGFVNEILVAREIAGFDPPEKYRVNTGIDKSVAKKCSQRGGAAHTRSKETIKNIFSEAAEGFRNRTQVSE
jgi:hypothetical protein